MTRYHPLLVALHWLVALMVLMSLLIGGPALVDLAHDDPDKLFGLTGHMIFGLVIGALMLIRLITKLRAAAPPKADAGHAMLNSGAQLAHLGLYVGVLAMVASGIGIALTAGLFPIAFGGSGAALPADFSIYPARVAHGFIATLLLLLIIAHLLGWAYHQFYLKDRLLRRMWFGKRS